MIMNNFVLVKDSVRALWIGSLLFVLSLSSLGVGAQTKIFPEMEGTWVLDSIRVQEVSQDSVLQRAIQPADSVIFDIHWMRQFTLNAQGKASFTEISDRSVSDVSYTIEGKRGKAARLMMNGATNYKNLEVELLSDSVLLITQAFATGYNLPDVNFFWKLYYHKSEE